MQEAPQDLARWRMQYALYKSDPDLQLTHARFPWIVTWDDHEVANDYSGAYDPEIPAPRAAAYRAWYEHQPMGRHSLPRRDGSLRDLPATRMGPARAVRRARHAAVPHGAALRLGRGSRV